MVDKNSIEMVKNSSKGHADERERDRNGTKCKFRVIMMNIGSISCKGLLSLYNEIKISPFIFKFPNPNIFKG